MSLNVIRTEVIGIASDLRERYPELTDFQALQLAANIVYTDCLRDCFGANGNGPAFLEAIAMQLGFGRGESSTVKDGLFSVSESLDTIAEKL